MGPTVTNSCKNIANELFNVHDVPGYMNTDVSNDDWARHIAKRCEDNYNCCDNGCKRQKQ